MELFAPSIGRACCPARSTNEFSDHKNAASVLPEPVGATTSAFSPSEIARHACSCTAVGAAKTSPNHWATCGWKRLRIGAFITPTLAVESGA